MLALLSELIKGRHLLASEEAERTALELFAEGGEKIDAALIEKKRAEGTAALLPALRLLVEMKLYRPRRKPGASHLLRTIEGADFADGR